MKSRVNRFRTLIAASLAALLWAGCSDEASGPAGPGPDGEDVILSNPVTPTVSAASTAGAVAPVTYVSLPPGTAPDAEVVVIRNVSGGDETGVVTPLINGGFDPVPVQAYAGNQLELEFRADGTVLGRKYGAVPARRPPSIVRVAPPSGRTDVALAVRPTVIFSEPVDATTVEAGVRLLKGGGEVEAQALSLPTEPWEVQVVPVALLEPATTYELEIGVTVRDLDGDALEAPAHISFTTRMAAPPSPPPQGAERIAFTSTRDGGPWIYLANADGSGVVPLVSGERPAWSWDGRMLAFNRGTELRIINADGSGERLVADVGFWPSWSPDGTKLVASVPGGVGVLNADGSGSGAFLPNDYFHEGDAFQYPTWSPDGQEIAVLKVPYDVGDELVRVWIFTADFNEARELVTGANEPEWWKSAPAWSPNGQRIAFQSSNQGFGPNAVQMHGVVASLAVDGTLPRAIHYDAPIEEFKFYRPSNPEWAPDGAHIAFDMENTTSTSRRIFVVELATRVARQLIPDAGPGVEPDYSDTDVAWSRAP